MGLQRLGSKYREDQERDEHGRFADEGGGSDEGGGHYSPIPYEQVIGKDHAGKRYSYTLEKPVESAKFIRGQEVTEEGVRTGRAHVIDKKTVSRRVPHRLNLRYGELEAIEGQKAQAKPFFEAERLKREAELKARLEVFLRAMGRTFVKRLAVGANKEAGLLIDDFFDSIGIKYSEDQLRDEQGRFTDGSTVYHATPASNVGGIMQRGLLPAQRANPENTGAQANFVGLTDVSRVYVSPRRDSAREMGKHAANRKHQERFVVFQIKLPEHLRDRLEQDGNLPPGEAYTLAFNEGIPAKYITHAEVYHNEPRMASYRVSTGKFREVRVENWEIESAHPVSAKEKMITLYFPTSLENARKLFPDIAWPEDEQGQKYSDDQPRDASGKWTSDGGGEVGSGHWGERVMHQLDSEPAPEHVLYPSRPEAHVSVESFESKYRYHDKEHAVVFINNEQYNGVMTNNDANRVAFSPRAVRIMQEESEKGHKVVLSHNHPNGTPQSIGDMSMAVRTGLHEIRATTGDGTYRMVLQSGWKRGTDDEYLRELSKAVSRTSLDQRNWQIKIDDGKIDHDEGIRQAWIGTWKSVAAQGLIDFEIVPHANKSFDVARGASVAGELGAKAQAPDASTGASRTPSEGLVIDRDSGKLLPDIDVDAEIKRVSDDVARILTKKGEKYSEDQPRDDQGRWTDGGGGSDGGGSDSRDALTQEHFNGKVSLDKQTADVARVEQALFGRELSTQDYARLLGVPDGAELKVITEGFRNPGGERSIQVMIQGHPYIDHASRAVYRDKETGALVIENQNLYLKRDAPPGFGTRMLAHEVASAREMGVKEIRAHAAGMGDNVSGPITKENGYYTWPRLGFETTSLIDLREGIERYDPNGVYHGVDTFKDLFSRPGGAEFWKINGSTMSVRFDTNKSSTSSRVLDAYLKAKGIKI